MSYEETLRTLGDSTASSVRLIWQQLQAGMFDEDAAADMMEIIILTARTQGEAFGALSFQTFMEVVIIVTILG